MEKNGKKIGVGIVFDFINAIATNVNFNYTVVLPEDNIIGNKTHGVLSMLYNNVNNS